MRNKIEELRAKALLFRADKQYPEAWACEDKANRMEKSILQGEVAFYTQQYLEATLEDNKTELRTIGALLRKKQIRLEKL